MFQHTLTLQKSLNQILVIFVSCIGTLWQLQFACYQYLYEIYSNMDEAHGLKNSLWHHIVKFERRKRDPRVLGIFKTATVYIFWISSDARVRCIFLATQVVNYNWLPTSFSLTGLTQSAFTCSKSTIETSEQCMKSVQS